MVLSALEHVSFHWFFARQRPPFQGTEGFRHCKKGTNVAGQAVGLSMGKRALAKGMDTFRLTIRGLGPGRASSVKGLEMAGIKIISITDRTPTPENGCKPRKARRV